MSSGSSASFCLIVCFLVCSSEAHENITADLGEDVTLTCKADNNEPIGAVQWSKLDLKPPYVLLYRNGRFNTDVQHPSYVNRTDLKDREMKDGDASLVLKNAKMEDRGTYECRVIQTDTEKYTYIIRTFNLEVLPPGDTEKHIGDGGDKDGNTGDGGNKDGIIAGSVVGGLILLAVLVSVGFLIYKRLKKKSHSTVPPDDAAGNACYKSF